MSHVRRKGEKGLFWMLDRECIGRKCFAPGHYQHRGATLSGSRNTGQETPTCLNNAYHGCPDETDERRLYSIDLAKERKAQGWKNA